MFPLNMNIFPYFLDPTIGFCNAILKNEIIIIQKKLHKDVGGKTTLDCTPILFTKS